MTIPQGPATSPLDVLIVDDGEILVDASPEDLNQAGLTVAVADSWPAALEIIDVRPVRAVILDHRLRGENGENVLLVGRRLPPVIVISGMGREVLKAYEEIYGDRVYACLPKPVDAPVLLEAVRGALTMVERA